MDERLKSPATTSPLEMTRTQRSHVLFVLSDATANQERPFLEWYNGAYRDRVCEAPGVIGVQHYERHEIDITGGQYAPLPLRYLGIYDLSFDGAQAAEGLISHITALHRDSYVAQVPATWLYYPVCERVGRSPATLPSMLTLAFANAVAGREEEFREWYATRHIRHALNVKALVSGQCFERTLFQRPGALEPLYSRIALYEQEGTPESILESFASLPESTFDFPAMDLDVSRFAESVYRPLSK